ncbi:MAG: RNA methyltransferase [Bdellovibrio sp.]
MINSQFSEDNLLDCPSSLHCSGCQWLYQPYSEQLKNKKEHLLQLFSRASLSFSLEPQIFSAGAGHLRDRLDFSWENGNLGLYHKEKREIVDLAVCPQLSIPLQNWLTEFRRLQWPFSKASIRLRVGPHGRRGAWLDCANIDIKALLDEQHLLHVLQKSAFVEIGQRRKVPFWNGQEWKLREPELHPWFQTWIGERAVDLYCQIASFTQPSLKANQLICNIISSWVRHFSGARLLEFGSGIGNLTLPALAACDHLTACEIDALSLEGLQNTLENLPADLSYLKNRIEIHRGDFQKKLTRDFSQFDGVLANPPRSGLMHFLDPLQNLSLEQRPPFFIYMSCFPESLVRDLVQLQNAGYELREVALVDQFPQTVHYEVLTLLQRK